MLKNYINRDDTPFNSSMKRFELLKISIDIHWCLVSNFASKILDHKASFLTNVISFQIYCQMITISASF
jgi:hypothetical protein